MLRRLSIFVAAICVLVISGCAGLSGNPPHPQIPTFTVSWPKLERAFNAPQSAVSVTFSVIRGTQVATYGTANRTANTSAYTQTVNCISPLAPGSYGLLVDFQDSTNRTVGTASLGIDLNTRGQVVDFHGQPLGSIGFTTAINQFQVNLASPEILTGAKNWIQYNGVDIHGGILAIPVGALKIDSQSGPGQISIGADGSVSVVMGGANSVVFSADGVKASAVSMNCRQSTMIDVGATWLGDNPLTHELWALTAQPDNNLIQIDTTTGQTIRTITLPEGASFGRFSSEGTLLYLASKIAPRLLKVRLSSGMVTTVDLPKPTQAFTDVAINDFSVSPGDRDAVAVTFHDVNDSGVGFATIYDSGVPRPNSLGIYDGVTVNWFNDSQLVTSNPGFSPNDCNVRSVDANGIGAATATTQSGAQFYSFYNGIFYGSNGTTYRIQDFQPITSIITGSFYGSPHVRSDINRVLFLSTTLNNSFNLTTLACVRLSDNALKDTIVPSTVLDVNGFSTPLTSVITGTNTLAFSNGVKTVLVSVTTG